ncbi:MAG TPA: class I SAM-dependent methyltransferase [Polyangia bacterium]
MILRKLSRLGAFLLGVFAAIAVVGIVFGIWNYQQNNRSWPREWAENRFRALKPYLKENAIAAELGVLKGDFSRPILQSLKPAKLHLVDPWYLLGPEWSWEKGDRSTMHALIGILKDYEKELMSGQVVLNIALDQEFLATLPDGYFDWVYLDTTHEYDQTKIELQLLQRKVKAAGVIAGDDWRPDPKHPHHGVYRAVQELIAEGKYELLYSDTENLQWAIRLKRQPSNGP